LSWGRADNQAPVILSGTPGRPTGTWQKAVHQNPSKVYGHAAWNMDENPHLADWRRVLQEECDRRGVTVDDTEIQREFFSRWIVDDRKMVFPVGLQIAQPDRPISGKVGGVDVGVVDDTSCVKIEYTAARAYITLAEGRPGLSGSQQMSYVSALLGDTIMTLIDPGGGGKALIQDFHVQGRMSFVPAEKQEKDAGLRSLRDAIRSGRLVAVGLFPALVHALAMVQWAPDGRGILGHMPDIIDALLYAWRYVEKFMPSVDETVFEPKTFEQAEQDALFEKQEEARRLEQERYC
jgi:hypothetical protein